MTNRDLATVAFGLLACMTLVGCSSSTSAARTKSVTSIPAKLAAQSRLSDQRCRELATRSPVLPGRIAAMTSVTMRGARTGLNRARLPIPTQWKSALNTEMLAVCVVDTTKQSSTPPMVSCPHGVSVGKPSTHLRSMTAYLVDANHTRTSLPARFLPLRWPTSYDPKQLCASVHPRRAP